ncbi:hypothetical protein [Tumebacillus flagellatus]|uniref:Uncharacterized protein n=1 Tax=Tumebacillus flagellatus TaxID=1157490 RepID=A0A074LNE3_9BACL|nr:hypothetical protein [Tumebacillus flagellatus]KEO83641.1 hypothetical protein EL26_08250 [Tumebacillus flagellatus]
MVRKQRTKRRFFISLVLVAGVIFIGVATWNLLPSQSPTHTIEASVPVDDPFHVPIHTKTKAPASATLPPANAPEEADISAGNPYRDAGIYYPKEFEAFFKKLQQMVQEENHEAVADLLRFPLRVNDSGKNYKNATREEFLNQYDEIMTTRVKTALINQKAEDLFVNDRGVMVGRGEIWINEVVHTDEDQQLVQDVDGNQHPIFTINAINEITD